MSAATNDARDDDIIEIVGRSWGWVLFFGIVTLVAGILVVIHPKSSVYVVAVVIGIWLLVAGLFRIVVAIADREDSGGTRWLVAIVGAFSVLVGLLFLRHTYQTVKVLALFLGIFWVVAGLIEFFSAMADKDLPARPFQITMGVLGFAAGVVTLFVPNLTVGVLAIIAGIWIIVFGLLETATAFSLRAMVKDAKG